MPGYRIFQQRAHGRVGLMSLLMLFVTIGSCSAQTICPFNGSIYTCPDSSYPFDEDSTSCCLVDGLANCCKSILLDTWEIGLIVGLSVLFIGVTFIICICCSGCPLYQYHTKHSDYRAISNK
eukprot:scpid69120/ scgid27115/ 